MLIINQYAQPAQPIYIGNTFVPQEAFEQAEKSRKAKNLGIWSIVLGSISPYCCGFILASVGLALGISGISKDKKSTVSIVGTIISGLMLILAIYNIINAVINPVDTSALTERLQEFMNEYGNILEQYSQQSSGQSGFQQTNPIGALGFLKMLF